MLFRSVHHDDIQFGMGQTDRGIVFLNGIGVWHQGFETVFPGVKQYYNMRNTLITMNMFEPHILQKKMKMWSIKRYIGMLISYRYADCEFVFKGYEDYLRGRQWLLDSDSESIHEELMAEYKRICPFDTVDNVLADEPDKGEILNYIKRYDKGLSPDELRAYYSHERFNGKLIKKLTFNGWFLPATDKLKVITPLDSPWDTYRHSRILLYEPATKRGVIMKRSNKEFIKGLKRIIKMATAW